jgi:hypothetical protein
MVNKKTLTNVYTYLNRVYFGNVTNEIFHDGCPVFILPTNIPQKKSGTIIILK